MIVECSNCQTRFQLDDSRVPTRGIRVRCSRCKEAFFLQHPDASEPEAVHDVARQAAQGGVPDATQDLPRGSSLPDAAQHSDPEEEDWQFNADLPDPNEVSGSDFMSPQDDPFAPPEDDDGDAGFGDEIGIDDEPDPADVQVTVPGLGMDDSVSGDDDAGSGLDLADGPVSSAGIDSSGIELAGDQVALEDEGQTGIGEAGSDFGEASDFSSLAEEDEEEENEAAPPAAAAAPAASEASSAPAVTPDVGEPEDWDFFSDESLEQPGDLGSTADTTGRAMEVGASSDPTRVSGASGPGLAPASMNMGPTVGALRWAGRSIGWLITLALFGIGLGRGVLDIGAPVVQPINSVDLGDFRAEQVRGSWLETARSTRLFAVTGQLVNASSEPRYAGAGLHMALLSPDGAPLDRPAVRAGLPIPEAELRELSSPQLASRAEHAVMSLAYTGLEPGQAVRFQAYFDGIPDEATGFVLEMVDEVPADAPPLRLTVSPEEMPPVELLEDPWALEVEESLELEESLDYSGVAEPTTPSSGAPQPSAPAGLPTPLR